MATAVFVVDQVAGHGFDKVAGEVRECLVEEDGGGDAPRKVWIHGGVPLTMTTVKFWIGSGDDDVYGVGGSGCSLPPHHCQCPDAVVALEA